MSKFNDDGEVRELIIIRRSGGDDMAAHKGGAWKIAYADFVTAMMAFFIVMWLINSANEATKARVASYFNPIKMTDATPSGRGLSVDQNPKRTETKEDGASEGALEEKEKSKKEGEKNAETGKNGKNNLPPEEAFMASPFQSLDKLSTSGQQNPSGQVAEVLTQRAGDPFDPMVWDGLRKGIYEDKQHSDQDPDIPLVEKIQNIPVDKSMQKPGKRSSEKPVGAKQSKDASTERISEEGETLAKTVASNEDSGLPETKRRRLEILKTLSQRMKELQNENTTFAQLNFEVKVTSEGILVVLEDGKNVSMFQIGSAVPNPELVTFIGRIGRLLEQQDGGVVVRGHTDARRFQGKKFDNWQLSTSRAHMASYMLIRGGLAESRLMKVEGYGSVNLLDKENPLADINRRVEILLIPDA